MSRITLNVPPMYADHHVTEVRRILFEIAGVEDVYASSSFQIVEVTFDPAQSDVEVITAALAEAGYAGTSEIPVEQHLSPTDGSADERFFRHTAAHANVGNTVSFAQQVTYNGRPLWPCPGMGVITVDTLHGDMDDG